MQEVDQHFMPIDWEGGMLPCGVVLDGYTVIKSYGLTGGKEPVNEGAVILLRKAVWEVDPGRGIAAFGKSKLRGRKAGLTVHARRCHDHAQKCAFVSVHLPFDNNASSTSASKEKLTVLRNQLDACTYSSPVILSGDFNTK